MIPVPLITFLGEAAAPLVPQLLRFAHRKGIPALTDILDDPGGYASRLGDLVVWHGSAGQKVLAGLQALGDNQNRIEQAITSIEGAQIATSGALGSLHTLACATAGLTSLSGALMLWRFHALNERFNRLIRQMQDLEESNEAQNKAHLLSAIQNLRQYDDSGDRPSLATARNEAQTATNIYGQLVRNEATARTPRSEALNYRGRCYLLALLTELRARLLAEDPVEAIKRFDEERSVIESFAKATFTLGIGPSPVPFLAAATREEGVTLELMTEIYQHAQRLGAFKEVEVRTSSDLFEYCRSQGGLDAPFIRWQRRNRPGGLALRLKYVMACFEDISRVEALKLLAQQIKTAAIPFAGLQTELRAEQEKQQASHSPGSVFAYSFA